MVKKIQVKLILELRSRGMSQREIAKTRKMSPHSVGDVCKIAKQLSLTYEQVKARTEDEVYQLFYPDKFISEQLYQYPDYEFIHSELKRTGVTLKLLWQEYQDKCRRVDALAMGYTKFCEGYTKYTISHSLTNHLYHKPAEVCEVDWSGKGMSIVDPQTGEILKIYLFVATLPYSQYLYVEPCFDMQQNTWLKCHVNMFEYFGGSTVRIVCDNLKTGVIKHPRQGEVILNKKYEELGHHYLAAITPAGVKKPKQKASVEGTVGKVATAIIAKLRDEIFYSLPDLKMAILRKLKDFNDAPFQKREGSRTHIFNTMERPLLHELPAVPYEVADWVFGHIVNLDCHVAYKTNRYSVPYQYVGKKVALKVTESLLEVYFNHDRLCTHTKLPDYEKYHWSTNDEHMPKQFQQMKWDDKRIKKWASSIGKFTLTVIDRIFTHVRVKEQGYNAALSILKLSKKYTPERLETACELALEKINSPRYRNLKSILDAGLDQDYLSKKKHKNVDTQMATQGYLRGADFYNGGDE